MTTTLFDDHENDHRPDPEQRRAARQLALGGVLQYLRAKNVWSVNDAASHAGIAPMTWRRLEDGLDVRQRTHVAIDKLLHAPFGTVKRALGDDWLMYHFLRDHGPELHLISDLDDVTPANVADFLLHFAEDVRGMSPRQSANPSMTSKWTLGPKATLKHVDATRQEVETALAALSQHIPAGRPTNLELATQLVERMTALPPTAAIDEAVHAILKAMPDLIARTCVEAEQDIADDLAAE